MYTDDVLFFSSLFRSHFMVCFAPLLVDENGYRCDDDDDYGEALFLSIELVANF